MQIKDWARKNLHDFDPVFVSKVQKLVDVIPSEYKINLSASDDGEIGIILFRGTDRFEAIIDPTDGVWITIVTSVDRIIYPISSDCMDKDRAICEKFRERVIMFMDSK